MTGGIKSAMTERLDNDHLIPHVVNVKKTL